MSGTLYVKFAKGETKKAKAIFNEISPDGTNIFPPDWDEIPKDCRSRGLYVEFRNQTMELDHAIWDQWSAGWSLVIAQALDEVLKIEKVGWCSVGWYKDMDEFRKSPPLIYDNPVVEGDFFCAVYGHSVESLLKIQKQLKTEAFKVINSAAAKVKL